MLRIHFGLNLHNIVACHAEHIIFFRAALLFCPLKA